jgi:hypothetical protein
MAIKKTREVPRRLEGVRRRIEQWRQTRKIRSRIPDRLWAAAVQMARAYGVNRTAQTLRLDYYGLKKRVEQKTVVAANATDAEGTARFVELAPFSSAGSCECSLELENGSGVKMRIQLKSIRMPDLAAISQTFWNRRP